MWRTPTPVISWDANPNFDSYNIGGSDIDVKIGVYVPKGIETLTFSLNTDNTVLNILLGTVGVTTDTDIDIINGDLVDMLQMLGINCGPSLYGLTSVVFDVSDLISLLPSLVTTSFSGTLALKVTDPEGHSAEQELTFYLE